ncbi:hypothetical protein B0H13DRAFT_1925234 [Mycena leptocephala]|nr:hypothetical protein B0H13DRAFT_1925234 [Mycena leptocephala]
MSASMVNANTKIVGRVAFASVGSRPNADTSTRFLPSGILHSIIGASAVASDAAGAIAKSSPANVVPVTLQPAHTLHHRVLLLSILRNIVFTTSSRYAGRRWRLDVMTADVVCWGCPYPGADLFPDRLETFTMASYTFDDPFDKVVTPRGGLEKFPFGEIRQTDLCPAEMFSGRYPGCFGLWGNMQNKPRSALRHCLDHFVPKAQPSLGVEQKHPQGRYLLLERLETGAERSSEYVEHVCVVAKPRVPPWPLAV